MISSINDPPSIASNYHEILIVLRNIEYDTFIYYSGIIKPFYLSRLKTITQFFSSRNKYHLIPYYVTRSNYGYNVIEERERELFVRI